MIHWKPEAIPPKHTARATWICDGDTFIAMAKHGREIIRLWGVDAPERGQSAFRPSQHALHALVSGKDVTITPRRIDAYGRIVATVATKKHPDVALELLERGAIWWDYRFARHVAHYEQALNRAREARRGIWKRTPYGQAPWEFRKSPKRAYSTP